MHPQGDVGLVVSSAARKHAIATVFNAPFDPKGSGLVLQYELQLKKGLECGGAYLKLLTATDDLSLDGFKADTPYTIMFGPDKCGSTNKARPRPNPCPDSRPRPSSNPRLGHKSSPDPLLTLTLALIVPQPQS